MPRLLALTDNTVAFEPPFGPPQGSLDPRLQAFLTGTRDIALLTRELAEADRATFRAHHGGREPVVIPVAGGNWRRFGYVDAVAIIVHRSNPVRSLSLAQLDAIFSTTRWRGSPAVTRWADVGVRGAIANQPIRLAGGGSWTAVESARALTVRRLVMSTPGRVGRWRPAPDSGNDGDVVERVGRDPAAIGFTGMGHLSGDVRAVPVSGVSLNAASAASGRYPLLRTVDLLVDAPGGRIDPRMHRFVSTLLSPASQQMFAKHGDFARLPPPALAKARRTLSRLTTLPACIRSGD